MENDVEAPPTGGRVYFLNPFYTRVFIDGKIVHQLGVKMYTNHLLLVVLILGNMVLVLPFSEVSMKSASLSSAMILATADALIPTGSPKYTFPQFTIVLHLYIARMTP